MMEANTKISYCRMGANVVLQQGGVKLPSPLRLPPGGIAANPIFRKWARMWYDTFRSPPSLLREGTRAVWRGDGPCLMY